MDGPVGVPTGPFLCGTAMPFHVYVLRSQSTGRLYIGTTKDVQRRLAEHESGRSKATRGRGPWEIVHTEQYATPGEARRREYYIKHSPGARREKRKWVAGP